ncbi:hypothetical protein [Pseudolactococcus reticulitermitis]|uniref:Squalene cyclase C-terminal domain-containing protein n=1 Tax=Pseudolactococcus reticulitermitis TaxID=2025039 RepID=A0A224XAH2_9LACT|nr:hypothetical protein [Lactococcus reticulitermitis]GAX46673.1 hypothetical protein RsY01_252 [Lactococcus reticulitermitis]
MSDTYSKARQFIYRNARPLDLARFQYHFENGSQEAVLKTLAVYQNEDGGFGHALEGDLWHPNSTPIQTWVGTEILRELAVFDPQNPIVKGILNYLASGQDFSNDFWYGVVPSNNDFPHAPWWSAGADYQATVSYNPTASLASFYVKVGDKQQSFYKKAEEIVAKAVKSYMASAKPEMHEISCYINLLVDLREMDVSALFDYEPFKEKLIRDVHDSIEKDTSLWQKEYVSMPSHFMKNQASIFYAGIEDLVAFEVQLIQEAQLETGAWAITWSWTDSRVNLRSVATGGSLRW